MNPTSLDATSASPQWHQVSGQRGTQDKASPEQTARLGVSPEMAKGERGDRVEVSVVARVLEALEEQSDDSAELQLPPDKLRKMITG